MILSLLIIVHVGHAKSKLAHGESICIGFSGVVTKAGLGILQADLSEFRSKPGLTLPKRGKAGHIESYTVPNRVREVSIVGKSNSRVKIVILQDVASYSLIGLIDDIIRELRENSKTSIAMLLGRSHDIVLQSQFELKFQ